MVIDQETIAEAIARPSEFGWWGDDKYFRTWGLCGPSYATNSGDALQQSNFEVIRDDLLERFPGEVEVVPTNHWAVGPLDQLGVHVIDDDGNPTECFVALLEWRDKLEAYPIADEEHYTALEWTEFVRYISNYTRLALDDGELKDDLPEDWAEQIAQRLSELQGWSRYEDISDDKYLATEAVALGFVEATDER